MSLDSLFIVTLNSWCYDSRKKGKRKHCIFEACICPFLAFKVSKTDVQKGTKKTHSLPLFMSINRWLKLLNSEEKNHGG